MARVINSMLGPMSGTLGNLVAYTWKGVQVVRSQGNKVKRKPTPAQLAHRAKIRLASSFLSNFNEVFLKTYQHRLPGLTERNMAMSAMLQSGIIGEYPNFEIDYPRVPFSHSNALPGEAITVNSPSTGVVEFSWTYNKGKAAATDEVILILYCPEKSGSTSRLNAALRSDNHVSLSVPYFSGKAVHTWVVFINSKGATSLPVYNGRVEVRS